MRKTGKPAQTRLGGAIERNSATAFHLGMAMLIAAGVAGQINTVIAVLLAVFLHSLLNMVAGFAAIVIENVWVLEGVVALAVSAVVLPIARCFLRSTLGRAGQDR